MVKEQIANTGILPSTTSADDGYSTQQRRDEVLGLGLKVVSINGAKGKKLIEPQQWNSEPTKHYVLRSACRVPLPQYGSNSCRRFARGGQVAYLRGAEPFALTGVRR
jgi:hypothetical protein